MQDHFSGAVIRAHGPLSLRQVDRLFARAGYAFAAIGVLLLCDERFKAGMIALGGGLLIAWQARHDRQMHALRVWVMAAGSEDPVRELALQEYLYGLQFRDLLVISNWRRERDATGLPIDYTDLDAPPQVRAIHEHLTRVRRES